MAREISLAQPRSGLRKMGREYSSAIMLGQSRETNRTNRWNPGFTNDSLTNPGKTGQIRAIFGIRQRAGSFSFSYFWPVNARKQGKTDDFRSF